jgi:hypothetical protein
MRGRRFPIRPAHPERNCWGCDAYCAAHDLRCGNGAERTPHPAELFGDDWLDWEPPVEATGRAAGALANFGAASIFPSCGAPSVGDAPASERR